MYGAHHISLSHTLTHQYYTHTQVQPELWSNGNPRPSPRYRWDVPSDQVIRAPHRPAGPQLCKGSLPQPSKSKGLPRLQLSDVIVSAAHNHCIINYSPWYFVNWKL